MSDKSKTLALPVLEERKKYQGENGLFGLCQTFTERYARLMERKEEIRESILMEFDGIVPQIEDSGYGVIDFIIDNCELSNMCISVIPHGGVAQRYPTIRNRLAREYFIPRMPIFVAKWREYIQAKLASLDEDKPEIVEYMRAYKLQPAYDKKSECFVFLIQGRDHY